MGETQIVLDSSHVMVPHGTNQRQRGLSRSPQERQKQHKCPKGPKLWFSKATAVLTQFFQGCGRDSKCSGLLTFQGTLGLQRSRQEGQNGLKHPKE